MKKHTKSKEYFNINWDNFFTSKFLAQAATRETVASECPQNAQEDKKEDALFYFIYDAQLLNFTDDNTIATFSNSDD